jgi:hypothetical protein
MLRLIFLGELLPGTTFYYEGNFYQTKAFHFDNPESPLSKMLMNFKAMYVPAIEVDNSNSDIHFLPRSLAVYIAPETITALA